MESAIHGERRRRTVSKQTLRRILAFARPHRRALSWFIVLSVIGSLLTVATPVLAGRVVDEITTSGRASTVVALAVLIGLVAIADAGFGLAERWQSAKIGEGVILDLRRAVFAHVQRMPVAFFMRTRTGALVSRLNNDVIGAQRAFTWTLSGVVSNVIALVLTLAVMLRLSWSITLLTLVLLPIFVIPARRMGSRLAHLEREAAGHNAAMTTQMTERFSAPGATLVKLFGDPPREEVEFGRRAERVAEIGVRSAMGQYVFLTALALVSALALAVVYGVGGCPRCPRAAGHRDGGDDGPVARPAVRPVDGVGQRPGRRDDRPRQLRASVRGARPRAADRRGAGRHDGPAGPGRRDLRRRRIRLSNRREGVPRLARGGRHARHPWRRSGPPPRHVGHRAGLRRRPRRILGRRQIDDRRAAAAALRRGLRVGADRRDRRPPAHVRIVARCRRDGHPGWPPVPREHPRQPAVRRPGGIGGRAVGGAARRPPGARRTVAAGGPRHGRRRARLPAVRRRTSASDDRPAPPRPAAGGDPRRGDVEPRFDLRGRRPGGADYGARRAHRTCDCPPALDGHRRRSDPRRRGRPHRPTRHPRRAARRGWPLCRAVPHPVPRRDRLAAPELVNSDR